MTHEYRVVPAPRRAGKVRGVRGDGMRFARTIEDEINRQAAEGWDYVRTDALPEEKRGWLGGSTVTTRTLLVFRRDRAAAAAAPMPVAMPEAAPPPAAVPVPPAPAVPPVPPRRVEAPRLRPEPRPETGTEPRGEPRFERRIPDPRPRPAPPPSAHRFAPDPLDDLLAKPDPGPAPAPEARPVPLPEPPRPTWAPGEPWPEDEAPRDPRG